MKYEVVGQRSVPQDNIIRDNYVALTGFYTSKCYPESFRLVEALVEVDGKLKKMTFITNNFTWSPSSIYVLACGETAGDTPRMRAAPEQFYLPGFAPGTT
ncbi:MAG: hypothetical protein WC082_15955 [Victivallales bacterium]